MKNGLITISIIVFGLALLPFRIEFGTQNAHAATSPTAYSNVYSANTAITATPPLTAQPTAPTPIPKIPPSGTTTLALPTSCSGISLTDDLTLGSKGTAVKCLQELLNQSFDTTLATTGPGSPGSETIFFGPMTQKAVKAFQEKNASTILTPLNLTTGTGFVGPKTRDALNQIIANEGGNSMPIKPQ